MQIYIFPDNWLVVVEIVDIYQTPRTLVEYPHGILVDWNYFGNRGSVLVFFERHSVLVSIQHSAAHETKSHGEILYIEGFVYLYHLFANIYHARFLLEGLLFL